MRKNTAITTVRASALVSGLAMSIAPMTPKRIAASRWWKKPTQCPNHHGLDDLDGRRNDEEPPEKEHRTDRGRNRPDNGRATEQQQCDPKHQKPPPILDDFAWNLDVESLNVPHYHGLTPLSDG